jgi:hypothetical protein
LRPGTLAALAGAILLLGAAGLLLLRALEPAPGPAGGDGASAPVAPAARDGPPPLPAPPDAPLPEITPPRIGVNPSAAAGVEWARVPVASKPSDLGRDLARPAFDALASARAQMDGCFEEEIRRMGRAPEGGEGHEGSAVLVLRLESRAGGLDVVATEVESRGDSSAELVSCARTVLEGWPIPAPAAAPGRRYRLKWVAR